MKYTYTATEIYINVLKKRGQKALNLGHFGSNSTPEYPKISGVIFRGFECKKQLHDGRNISPKAPGFWAKFVDFRGLN